MVSQGDGPAALSRLPARLSVADAVSVVEARPQGRLSPAWKIVIASLLFATMSVCVKLLSSRYAPGEIVFYRSITGALVMLALARSQHGTMRTRVPGMHFWRSATGVLAMGLWFYALGVLPLATAVTLNYMSSVWMALFLLGGAVALGTSRVDGRMIFAILLGFAGVALVLRPTIEHQQLWGGVIGLLSGMIAAMAYLQLTAIGRLGEPEYRIVFYFSVAGLIGGGLTLLWSGIHTHTMTSVGLLLAVGLLATAAQLLMTSAYSTGATLVNASLQYLGIAWSFVYGVVLFGDPVTWMALLGMLLIVGAGLAATQLRTRRIPLDSGRTPTES